MPIGPPSLPSGRTLGALLACAVVLSPVIIVGALGYGAAKGIAAGGRAVKGAVGNHSGKRFRNGVKRLHKDIKKRLGRDTLDQYIQELTTKINAPGASPQLYQQRAALYFAAMKYAEALQDLQVFLQHDPKNIIALFTQGYINSLLESFDEADKVFGAALDCLNEQGDAAKTPDIEVEGVSVPTSLRAYDIMFALASNKIHQALKHQPWKDEGTFKLLGEATALLDKFAPEEGDPETWRYLFMRAIVSYSKYCQHRSAPNLETASEDCRKACAADNAEAEAFSLYAQCLTLQGDNIGALTVMTTARDKDPNVFDATSGSTEELLAPWPMPTITPDGAATYDKHTWADKTFHMPTWCAQCEKFVKNSLMRHDFECKRCGVRVHSECKDLYTKKCVDRSEKK
eukprot:TRINITY_DN4808_c0_g1_i1.p1 TRINITY_DN4808_c0_g1~~TRINITY_DN4808_c0_g1_i1.p1  ORF type:complete len:400 (+),score=66.14 TRINITY_DN4808_c0_g1_i1:61-1260(+)